MPFSKDGHQVGHHSPAHPPMNDKQTSSPERQRHPPYSIGATDGNRTLAGAAWGLSQPCHPHAANVLLAGSLLPKGTAASGRPAPTLCLPKAEALQIMALFPLEPSQPGIAFPTLPSSPPLPMPVALHPLYLSACTRNTVTPTRSSV